MAPELWNVETPDAVEAVARGYVAAGSEIILTNTFGANRYALEKHGASGRVEELATAGVDISPQAAGTEVKVFASIGPSGKIVMMGEIGRDNLVEAYAEVASAIGSAGPDAIVLETFNELEELALALQAVRDSCDLPVVACMTFNAGQDGTATIVGNHPEDLARTAEEYGAEALGVNCGIRPNTCLTVARRLRAERANRDTVL